MLGDTYKWYSYATTHPFNIFLDPTVEELILVTDGCPHQPQNELEDMNTLVSNSGDGISARFQFDVFGFTSSDAVHIHCAIEICSVANSFECRRVCSTYFAQYKSPDQQSALYQCISLKTVFRRLPKRVMRKVDLVV